MGCVPTNRQPRRPAIVNEPRRVEPTGFPPGKRRSGTTSEVRMRTRVSGAWLLAGSLLLPALPAAAQIQVQVNGKPVVFGAVQPARVSGRVLIPLRAVVE